MYVLNNNFTYFNSFRVEHIPKETKIFVSKPMVIANIFRVQAYDLVMCGYFCIGFIDFMLPDKTSTNSFHQIILKRMMI